ncbi:MFS transporter, partial [Bacteroides uniformis]|uniref:MFS transporter n=3 Tax=Bacteroides TaxID=816 RepID=UPI0032ED1B25
MKSSMVSYKSIIPVMLAFFTMGFVDLVGIATNYVKQDFALSDTAANSFTVMVFLWFLVFSIPTGMLMNKIGRKNTVLLSMAVTFVGLLVPLLVYDAISMFFAFSFIGIGNTLMQVSLNPLLAGLVVEERLPSCLTLGQFIKSVASFVAPLIAVHAAVQMDNWRLLFLIFAVIDVMAVLYLLFTPVAEAKAQNSSSTFKECVLLLKNGVILLL